MSTSLICCFLTSEWNAVGRVARRFRSTGRKSLHNRSGNGTSIGLHGDRRSGDGTMRPLHGDLLSERNGEGGGMDETQDPYGGRLRHSGSTSAGILPAGASASHPYRRTLGHHVHAIPTDPRRSPGTAPIPRPLPWTGAGFTASRPLADRRTLDESHPNRNRDAPLIPWPVLRFVPASAPATSPSPLRRPSSRARHRSPGLVPWVLSASSTFRRWRNSGSSTPWPKSTASGTSSKSLPDERRAVLGWGPGNGIDDALPPGAGTR